MHGIPGTIITGEAGTTTMAGTIIGHIGHGTIIPVIVMVILIGRVTSGTHLIGIPVSIGTVAAVWIAGFQAMEMLL